MYSTMNEPIPYQMLVILSIKEHSHVLLDM
jgi:hypothetical protein